MKIYDKSKKFYVKHKETVDFDIFDLIFVKKNLKIKIIIIIIIKQ